MKYYQINLLSFKHEWVCVISRVSVCDIYLCPTGSGMSREAAGLPLVSPQWDSQQACVLRLLQLNQTKGSAQRHPLWKSPYSTLHDTTFFSSLHLSCPLLSSALIHSPLLSSPLHSSTLIYSTLLYSTLFYSTLLYSLLLSSPVLSCPVLSSPFLQHTQVYSCSLALYLSLLYSYSLTGLGVGFCTETCFNACWELYN